MLETVNPVKLKDYSSWKRRVSRMQLKFHLLKFERAYLGQLDREQARDYIKARIGRKFSQWAKSWQRIAGREEKETKDGNALEILYAAAANYRPQEYDGTVVLIRGIERTFGFARDLRLGWDDLLGDKLKIIESKGNHYTIYMDPNVDTLANRMNECVREAEQEAQGRVFANSTVKS
jgi:thioesterase domain-containing protein